jgi:tricorn protease
MSPVPRLRPLGAFAAAILALAVARAESSAGYYRFPALHGDTIVFTAEGDLWRVGSAGGAAQRLTSHPGFESLPAISPDGQWIAFSAQYEGPTEVYVMPLGGGPPKRLTYEGEAALVRGWTPDGKVLYATRHYSTLPENQLIAIEPKTGARTFLPLGQADEGVYDDAGRTLFFTRYAFQGSHAKRYAGGTAQNLWRLDPGAKEALPLHPEYKGTSHWPMWWQGRIYFASERDGTSNLWSSRPDGTDLQRHTTHADFGVKRPTQHGGRIVYQNGADLWLYDIASGKTGKVAITLASDFDQLRETWVTKPSDYVTHFNLSPDGDRLALVARGQVFVAPTGQGRLVEVTRRSGVRYRSASFLPDGKSLLVLSDESGEVEFWKLPANGVGRGEQLTDDGHTLRVFGQASPDGKWIVHTRKDQDLLVTHVETRKTTRIAHSNFQDFGGPSLDWSPDSRWLAYTLTAESGNPQIFLYHLESGQSTPVTSDRVISSTPAFNPDGRWLYFLSDRSFNTLVGAPWGPRQPEPFLDKPTKIYALALSAEKRSPFQPDDELADAEKKARSEKEAGPEKKNDEAKPDEAKTADADKKSGKAKSEAEKKPEPKIVLDGIAARLWEVPAPAGNYTSLAVTDKILFATDREAGSQTVRLVAVEIKNKDIEVVTVISGINSFRLSADDRKLLVQQREDYYVIDAAARSAGDLAKAKVNLGTLKFPYSPRESWRQMFVDAWRLHRDYFYDKAMHGVNWKANLDKHLPLAERVTDRSELNDLLNYLVSELSALHTDANGGDVRKAEPEIAVASLGARWARDEAAGGYRLEKIYRSDPDYPEKLGPLLKPGLGLKAGDVVLEINGTPTLSVPDAAALLRNQAGRQVLLKIQPAEGGETLTRIVTPITAAESAGLRYDDWEYSRRLEVDRKSAGQIGYVHLRAMGAANYAEWVRNYHAAANKGGLILDLRHNRGGNIDSWLLSRLTRPAWMWWSTRDGHPAPNMQNPFRGHLVVLIDAWTASDGETMANGVRHLGLGQLLGTRSWGGGIWLTGSNSLVDRGLARAAEFGSFIPGEGWVVEGEGVTPDIIVDNLPVATFHGEDAQLDAAIKHLQELIAQNPKHLLPTPPPPVDKSLQE